MILTVPRGTHAMEAEARLGFDAWPISFAPSGLVGYGEADVQRARDSFAVYQARKDASEDGAKADWRSYLPREVKARLAARAYDARAIDELRQISEAHASYAVKQDLDEEAVDVEDEEEKRVAAVMRDSKADYLAQQERHFQLQMEAATAASLRVR